MAGTATEQKIINKLQGYFESLSDVETAYSFAENPDALTSGVLPAVILVPTQSSSDLGAHHNLWKHELTITAYVYVIEREARGGKLRNLENRAMSLMQATRAKFTESDVVRDIISLGLSRHYTFNCSYVQRLIYMGTEYIGISVTFQFTEIG